MLSYLKEKVISSKPTLRPIFRVCLWLVVASCALALIAGYRLTSAILAINALGILLGTNRR
jgi:hypothetical protein